MSTTDDFSQNGIQNQVQENKIALFDADRVKYLITHRIKKKLDEFEMTGDASIFSQKEDRAIVETKKWLDDWFLRIKDPIVFCFSGKSWKTFRYNVGITKEYKGNRSPNSNSDYEGKSMDITNCMKYIQENYTTLIYEDLEADDILSMLQGPDTYIISHDKDLKTVPGNHYNLQTQQVEVITNQQAIYNLAFQLIIGDSTDNIAGLPGYGEKRAIELLTDKKPTAYINTVILEYQKKHGLFKGTDMFAETWMLVKMRENRGEHFQQKYKSMYDLKESLLLTLKK